MYRLEKQGYIIKNCLMGMKFQSRYHLCSYNKTKDALISQIYFWNRALHVLDSFSVHHQESSTVRGLLEKYPTVFFYANT